MARTTRRRVPQKKDGNAVVITTVKIRADLHNRARHYALDHGRTWQEVLDEALERYLKDKGA